ncbi:MAG: DUF4345 domain-containing protein [Candidatus Hydrogenedentes bacterium]|nr:DUF4345 domain-containing protein [Candidatus Hydrogenedentota bacterium]
MKSTWNRRLLQIGVALAALDALAGGSIYLATGLHGLRLTGSPVAPDPSDPAWAAVDYLFRALAGIWFSLGLMFAWMIPAIERHTAWFRLAYGAVFAMGLGRLFSVAAYGTGANPLIALILELIIPPLLILWQTKVARDAKIEVPP